jgi:hypothetical protein
MPAKYRLTRISRTELGIYLRGGRNSNLEANHALLGFSVPGGGADRWSIRFCGRSRRGCWRRKDPVFCLPRAVRDFAGCPSRKRQPVAELGTSTMTGPSITEALFLFLFSPRPYLLVPLLSYSPERQFRLDPAKALC